MMIKTILAADIGGTNSRFAHFEVNRDKRLHLVDSQWLSTTKAQSFSHLLKQLRHSNFSLPPDKTDIAVFGVAGPVERGTYCAPPYISWDIDLKKTEGIDGFSQIHLINDFVAQAYGCRSPIGQSASNILPGKIVPDATIGVLGAGTALGKAFLVPLQDKKFLAFPSEGGHASFPFNSEKEIAFQEFYKEKSGQECITGNLVVSGRGLRYIHWFLTGEELEPKEVAARFTPDCQTLSWAARFYGRACRNFALEVLAQGGLYVAGGVAARNPELLAHKNFQTEFRDSSTMQHILTELPVFLMDNQDSGLWGAAFYGAQILQQEGR